MITKQLKEIKRKIDLNLDISIEEIELYWYILNFKIKRYWNNGFYFKGY
jgi:hypothetical protein